MGDKKKQRTFEHDSAVVMAANKEIFIDRIKEHKFNSLLRQGVICKVPDSEDDVI